MTIKNIVEEASNVLEDLRESAIDIKDEMIRGTCCDDQGDCKYAAVFLSIGFIVIIFIGLFIYSYFQSCKDKKKGEVETDEMKTKLQW